MNLLIHLFGLLCGIGSATLASSAVTRWYSAVGALAGFGVIAVWTGLERIPNPAVVGLVLAVVAGLHLIRPGFFFVAAVASGVLAGCWVPVLRAQSVGLVPSILLALAVPGVSMLFTLRRPTFAPLAVYEHALLLVMVLGLALAAMPQVAEGWRSAGIMNLDYDAQAALGARSWVLAVGVGALTLGGCYSIWWRRR